MNVKIIAVVYVVLGQFHGILASSGLVHVVNKSALRATAFCAARHSSISKKPFKSEVARCNHFIELLERRLKGQRIYKREVVGLYPHERFFNPLNPKVNPHDAMNYWTDYRRVLTSDN